MADVVRRKIRSKPRSCCLVALALYMVFRLGFNHNNTIIDSEDVVVPDTSDSTSSGVTVGESEYQSLSQYPMHTKGNNAASSNLPSIDFISIGSIKKPDLQTAQLRTFGSHPTVRNFFTITELNDTDVTCYQNLTIPQVQTALEFCSNTTGQTKESVLIRSKLQLFHAHKTAPGWMCAQKRPIDGLKLVLERYKSELSTIPNYVVLMDDDSYFNMEPFLRILNETYPPNVAALFGGCIYTFPRNLKFEFPVGGFGSVFTRKTIENLLQPIYCKSSSPDSFTRMACWRIRQNLVGEQQFFVEGMTVVDLMHRYSAELPFSRVDTWSNGVGFCFHSDHALGYFLGFYHVGAAQSMLDGAESSDQLRMKNYISYTTIGHEKQCGNERMKCNAESIICHYASPELMDQLTGGTSNNEVVRSSSQEA